MIDIESALPTALHSLGANANAIDGAMQRRRAADAAGSDSKLLEAQSQAKVADADCSLKACQAAKLQEETLVVREQIGKTRAETAKLKHDASAPYPSASAGGAAGAGSKK